LQVLAIKRLTLGIIYKSRKPVVIPNGTLTKSCISTPVEDFVWPRLVASSSRRRRSTRLGPRLVLIRVVLRAWLTLRTRKCCGVKR
jgi:hypothetical protein